MELLYPTPKNKESHKFEMMSFDVQCILKKTPPFVFLHNSKKI